jgi:hypothetical protein
MHPIAILHEAQKLYGVSDRLDSLAEQHPLVSEVLTTISEAFATPQLCGSAGRDENGAALR